MTHSKQPKKGSRYIRDIGIYDEDELLVVIKDAHSYTDAFERFKKEYPDHPAHGWNRGYSARNI